MILLLFLVNSLAINLRLGILALQGNQQVLTQWNQTFEVYLPNMIDQLHSAAGLDVNATHVNITVVPLGFQQIFDAASASAIDLLYANPLIFACLQRELGVRSIATVENARLGLNQSTFGGVIFTRADSDIFYLEDIKGKIFSAVDFTSLGGFQAAWVTLREAGLDPFLDPTMVTFAVTHDQVVRNVINRIADVGTARTDTLEKWFGTPALKLNRSAVRILTPRNYSNFPFMISTDLYPEWPLGVMPQRVDEEVVRDITRAMLSLPPDPLGSYSRWLAPLSYEILQQLLEQINILNHSDATSCIRPANAYESVVCPTNYFKVSESYFATSCALANLTCPAGQACSCGACRPVPPVRFRITPKNSVFPCQKMERCTTMEELDSITFIFEDTWRDLLSDFDQQPVESLQYRLNDQEASEWLNATKLGDYYQFIINPPLVGTYVVEVAANGRQIQASPFTLRVNAKTCSQGYVSNGGICVTPERNLIGVGAKVFGWVVCVLTLVLLVCFLIWVFFNRHAKPVAASQPFFLGVMVFGCTLSLLAVFPASMDDEDIEFPPRSPQGDFYYPSLGPACEAQVWLYSLGFCFTFGALFAKVNRIRRVFQAKILHRIRITIVDMLPQTLSLVVIMSIIKLAWTISDSYGYRRRVVNSNENEDILESMGKCSSEFDSQFLGAILAIQIACYVYGLYLCYITRHFRAEFNEAKYITFCMANNAEILLLGAPLAALMADRPRALFLVKLFVVLLTVAGQIAFLFAPKFFLLQSNEEPDSFERSSERSGTGNQMQGASAPRAASAKLSRTNSSLGKDLQKLSATSETNP